MDGIAADDTPQRHDPVIGATPSPSSLDRDRDRAGDFERARDGDALYLGAGFFKHFHRAGEQQIGEVVVIACLDNQDARTFGAVFFSFTPARPSHHNTPLWRCTPRMKRRIRPEPCARRGGSKPGRREQAPGPTAMSWWLCRIAGAAPHSAPSDPP